MVAHQVRNARGPQVALFLGLFLQVANLVQSLVDIVHPQLDGPPDEIFKDPVRVGLAGTRPAWSTASRFRIRSPSGSGACAAHVRLGSLLILLDRFLDQAKDQLVVGVTEILLPEPGQAGLLEQPGPGGRAGLGGAAERPGSKPPGCETGWRAPGSLPPGFIRPAAGWGRRARGRDGAGRAPIRARSSTRKQAGQPLAVGIAFHRVGDILDQGQDLAGDLAFYLGSSRSCPAAAFP